MTDRITADGRLYLTDGAPAAPPSAPTDQTERRDRYAAAMAKRDGYPWPTEFEDDERDYRRRADAAMAVADAEQAASPPTPADADLRGRLVDALYPTYGQEDRNRSLAIADVVLAILPAPADRAAVLTATADGVERVFAAELNDERALSLHDTLIVLRSKLPCTCARSQGLHAKGCRRYVAGHELLSPVRRLARAREELGRMADETQQPVRPTPGGYEETTGHAITCGAGFGMGCQGDDEAQQADGAGKS